MEAKQVGPTKQKAKKKAKLKKKPTKLGTFDFGNGFSASAFPPAVKFKLDF